MPARVPGRVSVSFNFYFYFIFIYDFPSMCGRLSSLLSLALFVPHLTLYLFYRAFDNDA